MQVVFERCAAIDIGKDEIVVAVRLPDPGGGRATVRRSFTTFYGVLKRAARWLTEQGVTHVAMESTGVYSMPVYHALLAFGDFEQILVCNAGHVKNVPGRKTDMSDAQWLAELLECGLLRGSFIPSQQVKAARDVVRYRSKLTESRTSELQRLGNVLQDAGVKIDSVASSLTTVSARLMVEALIDGERRPGVLADLARGRMRSKITDLEQALDARFGDHHALMCRLHLEHLDHLDALIGTLDEQIEAMMQPFRAEIDLLISIPGIGERNAPQIIAEIGDHVGDWFPSAAHLASWVGLCPGQHESAGKRTSGRRRQGNKYLQAVLVEAAWSAVRTTGSYFHGYYTWNVRKFGGFRSPAAKKKAIIAVAHKLAIVIWHVLTSRTMNHPGSDGGSVLE